MNKWLYVIIKLGMPRKPFPVIMTIIPFPLYLYNLYCICTRMHGAFPRLSEILWETKEQAS